MQVNADTLTVKAAPAPYRPTAARTMDLIHMDLDVTLDYDNQWVIGEAEISFRAYRQPQNQLVLDAKGFDISSVVLIGDSADDKLEFSYDRTTLTIALPNSISRFDTAAVRLRYIAKPNELPKGKGRAIQDSRGLYFINPTGADGDKMRQIWTQGETEYNSCWFPTIDKPNERITHRISVTVDTNEISLSNGELEFSTLNEDGTRTDVWYMDTPHAPYLVMLAVGDFSIIKDEWNGMPVHYYVENEYAKYARDIFGKTPEMIDFFSKKMGVDYPWSKYHQIVVRDYVSGAMENTTAVIHGDFLYQNPRQMVDGNNEDIIAHELFHHWFGDYVTCESWSNLTLNEGFASYGEYLWKEYSEGRNAADEILLGFQNHYFRVSKYKHADMIRRRYQEADEVFDEHSYDKGACILHMLRSYLGDQLFFGACKHYLNKYALQSVEIHDLRLAFEEYSGKDLNWFFDQWFLDSDHPKLRVNYNYEDESLLIRVQQLQKNGPQSYFLPLNLVAVSKDGKRKSEKIWLEQRSQEFLITLDFEPAFVEIDGTGSMLAEFEESKPYQAWEAQYDQKLNLASTRRAIDALLDSCRAIPRHEMFFKLMSDSYGGNRLYVLESMDSTLVSIYNPMRALATIVKSDKSPDVRAEAIYVLGEFYPDEQDLKQTYKTGAIDSSLTVAQLSTMNLADIDLMEAMVYAERFQSSEYTEEKMAAAYVFGLEGNPDRHDFFLDLIKDQQSYYRYEVISNYTSYLLACPKTDVIVQGIGTLKEYSSTAEVWWFNIPVIDCLAALKFQKSEELALLNSENLKAKKQGDQQKMQDLSTRIVEADQIATAADAALQYIKDNATDIRLKSFLE